MEIFPTYHDEKEVEVVRRRRKIRKFTIPKNCGRRTTEEVTTTQTESSSLVGDEKEERKKKDSFNENL